MGPRLHLSDLALARAGEHLATLSQTVHETPLPRQSVFPTLTGIGGAIDSFLAGYHAGTLGMADAAAHTARAIANLKRESTALDVHLTQTLPQGYLLPRQEPPGTE